MKAVAISNHTIGCRLYGMIMFQVLRHRKKRMGDSFMQLFQAVYNFLWGDLVRIPLPGGSYLGLSLLIIILIPAGIFCTIRTKFLPVRLFPEMIRVAAEKKIDSDKKNSVSGLEALIVSTATRVGMGNLVGVVAAVSAGGAGALFWMWVTAIIGSSTAFVEATLAQIHRKDDPLYGGYRGGPAYYIHDFLHGKKKKSVIAILFALSGLLCWCGISQVIGNSVSSALDNAFHIPPLATAIILCVMAAVIVLRRNVTVKVLDVVVPVMAGFYFFLTVFLNRYNPPVQHLQNKVLISLLLIILMLQHLLLLCLKQ